MGSASHSLDLAQILGELNSSLQKSLEALNREPVKSTLYASLHNDENLPDKKLASLAAKTVDLLAETELMLQPAHLVLADHFLGYTNTKCLLAAVELGIPDHLAVQPLTLSALAQASKAKPHRLQQVLKPLYNNGIFTYDAATNTYSNNHVSALLHSTHWTQWHNWVSLYGTEFYDIARGIPSSLLLGTVRSAAQINFDTDDNMFTYFQRQGWLPRLHRTLGGGATAMAPGILEDYAWAEVGDRTVMDVGGGGGGFVATLLRRHPRMRGGVYDLDAVVEHAASKFGAGGEFADLGDRVPRENLVAGDFMAWVPPAEVYTMKWVLHDWEDEDAVTILRNVRAAIVDGPASRLVVLESILEDGRMGRLSRYGDINMMMTAKGQERTEEQWRNLALRAGWRVTGIFPLRNAWVQAIELKP